MSVAPFAFESDDSKKRDTSKERRSSKDQRRGSTERRGSKRRDSTRRDSKEHKRIPSKTAAEVKITVSPTDNGTNSVSSDIKIESVTRPADGEGSPRTNGGSAVVGNSSAAGNNRVSVTLNVGGSGGNSSPRQRRPSIGGGGSRPSSARTHSRRPSLDGKKESRPPREGPNFLATFDNARLSCKPLKDKKKKAHKSGEKINPDAVGLSRLDIAQLWQHYDRNSNGLLDPNEVEELAEDLVDRIPTMYREMLAVDHPKATPKALDDMLARDLPHIMPGDKSKVFNFLMKELPFNYPSNKKIREQEFTARWNATAQKLFAGLHLDESGSLGCVIL